jgi:branched-chain amino acid transport system permease protein
MGISFAIKAFVIVVIGGMGSIKGSIIAAYLLAMVESLGSLFFLDPSRAMAYREAYGLLLLILILSIRPQGLFGELERRA